MDSTILTSWSKGLLKRSGGYFILIAAALAQAAAYLVTIPVSLFVWTNAEFNMGQFRQLWSVTAAGMVLSLPILSAYLFLTSRQAFSRLQDHAKDRANSGGEQDEAAAWKQISSLPWRFAKAAALLALLVAFLPTLAYEIAVLKLDADRVIYTAIGVCISSLILVPFGVAALEGMLAPARQALLPGNFQTQLTNAASLRLLPKLSLLILTLIAIGILLVAPIGYRFTSLALQESSRPNLLFNYQIQSVGFSLFALLLGAGLAWMLSRSVAVPLNNLVEIFLKVEQGDLHQQAPVISSDETGELTILFNRMIHRVGSLQSGLEEQVANRTAQLEAVIEVGRAASAILDPDKLIERTVNLITDRFGHYYAAIFLLDASGRWAELKNATGEAGRVLRESHHRLAADNRSMVGAAVSQKQARIALDAGLEPVRFNNPLLPYTRSEIALPLIVGDRVLGALDIQSTYESAFGDEAIETFQSMANQVAIALENARLFQETRQRLQELQIAQRQYIHEAWQATSSREPLEYGVGDEAPHDDGSSIEVPLTLRSEVIGQISMTGEGEWSAEERAWIESVATQASIALENARLMDENRRQAGMERAVAEITTHIWSVGDIDGILQPAVREIGRAFNLAEATISLQMDGQGANDHE